MINQSLNMTLSIMAAFAKTEPSIKKSDMLMPFIENTHVDEDVKNSLKVIANKICLKGVEVGV